jgi:predicted transcriptional regulator
VVISSYEHPDFVEMYPGMVSESAKVPMVVSSALGAHPRNAVKISVDSDSLAWSRHCSNIYHLKSNLIRRCRIGPRR